MCVCLFSKWGENDRVADVGIGKRRACAAQENFLYIIYAEAANRAEVSASCWCCRCTTRRDETDYSVPLVILNGNLCGKSQ